jgi:hypothetical protein
MGAPRSNRSLLLLAVAAVVAVAAGLTARHLFAARAKAHAAPRPSSSHDGGGNELVLRVPHMAGAITLDGDTDDPGWTSAPGPARTGDFFMADGTPARPFSEVRLLWGDGYLYLALYAADEDIETRTDQPDGPLWLDDAFHVILTQGDAQYLIDVSPKAILTDAVRHGGGEWDYSWRSQAHASKEVDGTINSPKDMDEEWAVEMAIPFESLGLQGEPGESIGLSVSRCDTPRNAQRVCTSWGDGDAPGRIVLK